MQILSTKLSIPPLRSRLVARTGLIHELNQGLDCGLVLISAPAGYGNPPCSAPGWGRRIWLLAGPPSIRESCARLLLPATRRCAWLNRAAHHSTFVQANDLQARILSALKNADASLPATLETASEEIRGSFARGEIPPDIADSIREACAALGQPERAVAVRSSATAEDLPEASFAGQQETYLNICGNENVLDAVKKCWASLWTARAIAYRIKNQISPGNLALAVVVQEMVNAETAGILFTANPVNGRQDEVVINAAWGLGEAIVGGLVSPDTIVADKASGKVKKMEIAEKAVISVLADTGTEIKPLSDARRKTQVLKETQVVELVGIARRIEDFYATPQDIEWCAAGGRFSILQSRPITDLPQPEISQPAGWKLPKGAYAAMRNNIVELMADPLSPLFATLGLSVINTSPNRL